MQADGIRDEQGLIVRTGRDPKMVMEEGSEAAAAAAASTTSESVQGAVSEVGAEVTTTETIASTANTGIETDPFDDAKVETFDRAYVQKLRESDAAKRVELKKFKETFEDWPSEAVEGFLGLAQAIANEDQAAVPVLQNLLNQLTPEQQAAVEDAIEQQTVAQETKYMTPQEVEEYIAQRETQKEQERETIRKEQEALDTLKTEIEGLGYNLNEPNPEAALLFHFASLQDGEGPKDFKAAHEAVEALFQQRIDDYVGRVAGRNSRFNKSAAVSGLTPAGVDGGKKNLGLQNGGSRKAMEAFLDSVE